MTSNILRAIKCLCFSLFLFGIKASAQNISGIYSGTLVNDSLKMVQNYELALSEYRGKITGYSYITFVTNDTFYYGIKRIKASRQNGELVVEDVEMLANNYPKRPDKGVHVINRIPLPPSQDTILDMKGKWETTATKKFYSISGDLTLRRNNDSTQSPLIAHLTELKEINYQDEKKNTRNIAKTEVKQKPKEEKQRNEVAYADSKPKESSSPVTESKPTAKETIAVASKEKTTQLKEQPKQDQKPQVITAEAKPRETQQKEIVSTQTVPTEQKVAENKPSALQSKTPTQTDVAINPASNSSAQVASTEKRAIQNEPLTAATATANNTTEQNKVATATTVQKPSSEQPKTLVAAVTPAKEKEAVRQTVVKQTVSNTQSQSQEIKPASSTTAVVASEQPKVTNTVNTEPKAAIQNISAPPVIAQRASNTIQTLTVVSDSLILSFYDNGVVDGDSISVYLNTENIISSVKLKEAAVKKTIYINNRSEDMKLTLVADNLGSIPPNTGLLIIQDGNERYQIRFSADLQTNASVILRKKR